MTQTNEIIVTKLVFTFNTNGEIIICQPQNEVLHNNYLNLANSKWYESDINYIWHYAIGFYAILQFGISLSNFSRFS